MMNFNKLIGGIIREPMRVNAVLRCSKWQQATRPIGSRPRACWCGVTLIASISGYATTRTKA